jgi:hypothetical protein
LQKPFLIIKFALLRNNSFLFVSKHKTKLQDQVNEGRQNKNVGAKTALLEGKQKQKIIGN